MAEPRARSGWLQIHVDYAFDRLRESKLAQAYDILVPSRERPVGGSVKEFDDEDDGDHIRPREGHAVYRLRASGTSPSSDFSPNPGHPFTSSAYGCAFARRSLHAEHPMRSSRVTTCSSAPCRPHTPWFEGWMDNAFVAMVPTRPCPLFGRPVHRRDGSHRFRPGASPQALRIPPHGGHPALLDFPRGQRGITPAFGYGAPHPSIRGTSTHLSTSLPSAHCRSVRLPRSVRHRRTSLDFPMRPKAIASLGRPGISRFPSEVLAYVHGVSDRAGLGHTSRYRCTRWSLPLLLTASASRSEFLTRLNARPARSPVNASTLPLRAGPRDSGPMWVATSHACDFLFTTPRRFNRRTRSKR
jgi:hypothetical protein